MNDSPLDGAGKNRWLKKNPVSAGLMSRDGVAEIELIPTGQLR